MNRTEREGEPRWTSWVLETRNQDGEFSDGQVWELLLRHRGQARPALQKMQRLEDMGWPEARSKLKVAQGRAAIVRPDKLEPEIWELKTTPHEWRLYFHPVGNENFIIYTYAIYKTQQKQNPQDVISARNALLRLGNRTARRKRLHFSR